MSQSRLILFRLRPDETEYLREQLGVGGFQQKFFAETSRLDLRTGEIALNDAELGKIVRYCSYGPGGFQSVLKKIFLRSIEDMLHGHREK
ncbi:hypothetical protein K6W36_12455 [Acetobacter senegalensis]|uniref:hypothetical protein n=1 Tax=Acetobacter senegalensis TaxID=446692 RepID=UPI001EDA0816|nr:hypothetical protein [Acetobacter senegalensis]MCG4261377.1 hypothetical protein [Acetobacter senegalensis]